MPEYDLLDRYAAVNDAAHELGRQRGTDEPYCINCGDPVIKGYDGLGTGWSHSWPETHPRYLESGNKQCRPKRPPVPRPGCTEHLACRLPHVPSYMAEAIEREGAVGPYLSVEAYGEVLGSVRDVSFSRFGGGTVERWSALGGGNHLGDTDTQAAAVKLVVDNANSTSIHWRMALHG